MSDIPMRKKIRRLADALGVVPPAAAEVTAVPPPPVTDPLRPSVSLLAKLGFIAVRASTMLKVENPEFERLSLHRLLLDKEVNDWVQQMSKRGYIPKGPE